MNYSRNQDRPRLAYRVREFCEQVGICPATFYNRVRQGRIRTIKIADRTLVPASEVERLLKEGA